MVTSGNKVLIIEHDRDLQVVFEVMLRDEGFEVETIINEDAHAISKVRETRPDLVILDILPTDSKRSLVLLDALRSEPIASQIPVLVMSTAKAISDASLASYNVKAVLTKPFELTQFLFQIETALGLPIMHRRLPQEMSPQTEAIQQVEHILTLHSRDMLLRWVTSLKLVEPWKSRPEIGMVDMLDAVPALIDALITALRYQDPEAFYKEHSSAIEHFRQHSLDRRSQGLPFRDLIREYAILREEMWSTIWRYFEGDLKPSDVLAMQVALDGAFDRIIAETIPFYFEAEGSQ